MDALTGAFPHALPHAFSNALTLEVPLDARFFLQNQLQIDRLLAFSDWVTPALDADIREAVELMVPCGCVHPLIRIGGDGDGAYLVPDDLRSIDACFSPGVATTAHFERQLAADYGIPSYLCDASVDGSGLGLDAATHVFSRKWLGAFEGGDTQSLDGWVLASDHANSSDLLLQMDIEASEYAALMAVSDSVLRRFRILAIEFHMLDALQSAHFLNTRFLPVMRKLLHHFDCVHAHANNCLPAVPMAGYVVPPVIELSFYRKQLNSGRRHPWSPQPLDVVNVPENPPLCLQAPWV